MKFQALLACCVTAASFAAQAVPPADGSYVDARSMVAVRYENPDPALRPSVSDPHVRDSQSLARDEKVRSVAGDDSARVFGDQIYATPEPVVPVERDIGW